MLESRYFELESANNRCVDLSLKSEATESKIMAEIETHEEYKLKFLQAKTKFRDASSGNVPEVVQPVERAQGVPRNDKPFKRPILEIPKFSGSVNKLLQFW